MPSSLDGLCEPVRCVVVATAQQDLDQLRARGLLTRAALGGRRGLGADRLSYVAMASVSLSPTASAMSDQLTPPVAAQPDRTVRAASYSPRNSSKGTHLGTVLDTEPLAPGLPVIAGDLVGQSSMTPHPPRRAGAHLD